MTPFSVYDSTTGEAVSNGSCADQMVRKQFDPATQVIFYDRLGRDHYYDVATETVVPKLIDNITHDYAGVSLPGTVVTMSGIPEGSVMSVAGFGDVTIDASGELRITMGTVGRYSVTFTHIHYLQHAWGFECDD